MTNPFSYETKTGLYNKTDGSSNKELCIILFLLEEKRSASRLCPSSSQRFCKSEFVITHKISYFFHFQFLIVDYSAMKYIRGVFNYMKYNAVVNYICLVWK